MSRKILLTSVCHPMGPKYGDAPSVGYELLYRQVLRAQGIFSPRTHTGTCAEDYLDDNPERLPNSREHITTSDNTSYVCLPLVVVNGLAQGYDEETRRLNRCGNLVDLMTYE